MSWLRALHTPQGGVDPRDPRRAAGGRLTFPAGLIWAVVGAAICGWTARLEPNLLEEGMLLHVAQRLAAGERLYVDVIAFTGPLPFEALALLFRWLGEDVAVARGALAVLTGLACAAVYGIGRRAGVGPLAHAVAATLAVAPVLCFPLYTIYFYTTLALHLSVIATYAAVRGQGSTRWAVLAGLLVAAVALCKQTVGLALGIAFLAAFLLDTGNPRRAWRTGAWMLGGAVGAIATLAVYAVRGELGALVHALVVLPLSFDAGFETPAVNLWPPGRFDPEISADQANYLPFLYLVLAPGSGPTGWPIVLLTQLLFAAPLVAILATALRRLRGRLAFATVLNLGLLCAAATNLHPRSDWGHLVYALPIAIAQLLLLAGPRAGGTAGPSALRGWAAGGAVVVLAGAAGLAGAGLERVSTEPTFGPRVPLRPVSGPFRADTVPRVIDYLRDVAEPGEGLFVARAEPLIYFATDLRNPTPYSGVLPAMRSEQERAVLAGLAGLRHVVMSDLDGPTYTYYSRELPAVQRYLERHFGIPGVFTADPTTWMVVLERGPDRGETLVDLVDVREGARPFVRDAEGRERDARPVEVPAGARHNRRPLVFRVGPLGGGIDFEIDVPPGAVLQADGGLGYVRLGGRAVPHPAPAEPRISIGPPGSPEPVAALRVEGDDAYRRTWSPVEVDLAPWSGTRVVIRLELVPDEPLARRTVGWWGSPRIARARPAIESPR